LKFKSKERQGKKRKEQREEGKKKVVRADALYIVVKNKKV
jgi:hypothetical protein